MNIIAINYFKLWFWLDLISIIPISEAGYYRIEGLLKCIRLLKVSNIYSIFNEKTIEVIIIKLSDG